MKQIVCIFLLLILISSCLQFPPRKTYSPRYGVEYNRMRDSLGIVLLDSSWVASTVLEGGTIWGPKVRSKKSIHGFKHIAYSNDTLYCELDTYGNGETYQIVDGEIAVCLDVMYFHRPARSSPWSGLIFEKDSVGWVCNLSDSLGEHSISKAQADSIIEAWQMARDNENGKH